MWSRDLHLIKCGTVTLTSMGKAKLNDLIDTWWKTAEAMEARPGECSPERSAWHASVFESVLIQCGWSVSEWNEAVDNTKKEGEL